MRLNYLVVLEIIRTHKEDDCCNSLQIYYYSIFEIAYYFQVHHQPSPKNKFQIFFKDIIRGLALSMNSEEFSYLSSFKSLQQQSGLLPCLDDYFSPSSPTFTTTISIVGKRIIVVAKMVYNRKLWIAAPLCFSHQVWQISIQ